MLGAVENVGGGLVDRNSAGIGGGVCLFLAHMELEGFKVKLVLCRHGEVLLRFEVRGSRVGARGLLLITGANVKLFSYKINRD